MFAWRLEPPSRLLMALRHRFPLILSVTVLALAAPALFSKEGMDRNARIDIIRGLLREVGVTKVSLPRGKRGVRLDAKGKLDLQGSQKEIHESGLAMQAGVPAEITRIEFKSSQIMLDLNGGGRSGKKWYQHIEIGMGTETSPVGPQQQP